MKKIYVCKKENIERRHIRKFGKRKKNVSKRFTADILLADKEFCKIKTVRKTLHKVTGYGFLFSYAASFNGRLLLRQSDGTCNFVGTHTSCANVNRFDIAVCFCNFNLFYVGFPFSIRASTNLTTVDTNSMAFHLALLTNFTFSHFLHLLSLLL